MGPSYMVYVVVTPIRFRTLENTGFLKCMHVFRFPERALNASPAARGVCEGVTEKNRRKTEKAEKLHEAPCSPVSTWLRVFYEHW